MVALVVGHEGQDGTLLRRSLALDRSRVIGVGRETIDEFDESGVLYRNHSGKKPYLEILEEFEPTEIYYLAAEHSSAEGDLRSSSSVEAFKQYFVGPTTDYLSLLNSAQLLSLPAPIFFAASSLVFEGNTEPMLSEESSFAPMSFYGMSKAQGLWLGDRFREDFDLRVFGGILFNHESSLRRKSFFTAKVIAGVAEISEGKRDSLELHGLERRVDWGHAEDFVEAFRLILRLDHSRNFVVATGEKHSVREFVDLVFQSFGLSWGDYVRTTDTGALRNAEIGRADISRLSCATGWAPSQDFPGFVRRLVSDFLHDRESI